MKNRLSETELHKLLYDLTNALTATRIGICGTPREFNRDNPVACGGCVFTYDQEVWVLATIRNNVAGKPATSYLDTVFVRHLLEDGEPAVELHFTMGEGEDGIYKMSVRKVEEGI